MNYKKQPLAFQKHPVELGGVVNGTAMFDKVKPTSTMEYPVVVFRAANQLYTVNND